MLLVKHKKGLTAELEKGRSTIPAFIAYKREKMIHGGTEEVTSESELGFAIEKDIWIPSGEFDDPEAIPQKRGCTVEYKINPINRYIDEIREGRLVDVQIGISTDEMTRCKDHARKWGTNKFPLIEKRMSRHDCLKWMENKGYPKPPRSACVYCPFHKNEEWQKIKTEDPESFAEAVRVDKMQRNISKTGKETFLHRSLKPLDEIDFENEIDSFGWGGECDGMCGL